MNEPKGTERNSDKGEGQNKQSQENVNHDTLMSFLQHPEILRQKLQNFVDEEKGVFGDSMSEINELANYVMSNWRQIVPPIVAFGLSVLLKRTENMAKPIKASSSAVNHEGSSDETLLN